MKADDHFILSKGHAAALLYSVLAEEGVLTESDIDTFYKNGTHLSAHPPVNKIKGIPFATGSLGHGLSIAAGLGLANKLKNNPRKIFCITSEIPGSIADPMVAPTAVTELPSCLALASKPPDIFLKASSAVPAALVLSAMYCLTLLS